MAKVLLAITTAGRLHWLKGAIKSLGDPVDILVVDDSTPARIGIGDFCQRNKIHFITKKRPRGLTNSWNKAYQFFKEKGYQNCILSNDDVRFPRGFSSGLMQGLQTFSLVGPCSNSPGTGKGQRIQRFIDIRPIELNINPIQKAIFEKHRRNPFMITDYVNGFCFAFSRSIEKFRFSGEFLFDPKNINTMNEGSLCRKIKQRGGKIAICKTSYVWHVKRGTYRELRLKNRDHLWR